MRTIDADALFRAMEEAEWYNNCDRDVIAEKLVLDAPTIEPEQKWIQCKEKSMKVKLYRNATCPTRGTSDSAGLDLYATDDHCIWTGETVMIDTGVALELPEDTFGMVVARSGLSTKQNLTLANGVGIIDCDYRNTIKVPLHNLSQGRQWIKKGDRIAQLVIVSYVPVELEVVDELSDTERGMGGFGSTGR